MIVSTHPRNKNELSFGVWMMVRRQDVGMTRKGLAEKAGISSEFVRSIENGYRLPSVQTAIALLKALEVEYETDKDIPGRFYFDFDSVINVFTQLSGRTKSKSIIKTSTRKAVFKSRKRCCHI